MRLSTRLASNAATTYLRLGATLALGLFTTWYTIGAVGVIGFGVIALAGSSASPSRALGLALRFGLVRELAAALSGGDEAAIRRSVASAFRLCLQAALPVSGLILAVAAMAWAGFFNTPGDEPGLELALAVLIVCEGFHAVARLLSAPHLQSLFASQRVALDNLLMVVERATYALSAVVVFGWLLPDADLAIRLMAYGVSRATLQLADVALGVWLAKRQIPGLALDRTAFDEAEYRAIRGTVWQWLQVAMTINISPQFLAVVINLFFGLTYNGIWQIVVQFAGFARMLAEGLLRGIAPLATHLQEGGRLAAAIDLMRRSIRYQLAVTLPAVILLGLWARPLLELWVGDRLAADPHLAAAGLAPGAALGLAATMVWILLATQTVRAAFMGVERVLFGLGKVGSFAWFSKWAAAIAVGCGAALMAWLGDPVAAPIALLAAYLCYSPGAVLAAARRETGLAVGDTLRRSVARPLAAALVLFAMLAPVRLSLERLTVARFAVLLGGIALVYGLLALFWIAEADERDRLRQFLRQGWRWMLGRAGWQSGA